MKSPIYIPAMAAAVAILFYPAFSPATKLLKMSIEDLTLKAESIVIGDVVEVDSGSRRDQTTIDTTITVKVSDCLKGSCTPEMVIVQRGGSDGFGTLYIPGMPRFIEGEKVLLFLRLDPEGRLGKWSVVGMCQGIFNIEKNNKDGRLYAQQQGGAALAAPGPSGRIEIIHNQKPLKILLKNLILTIKKIVTLRTKEARKR